MASQTVRSRLPPQALHPSACSPQQPTSLFAIPVRPVARRKGQILGPQIGMLDAAKAALEDSEAIPGMAREVCRNGAEQVVVAAPAPLGFLDGFPLKEVSERASAVR